MKVTDVRNNHLQDLIDAILDFPGDYVDGSLVADLKRELIFSTFVCPDCGAGLLMLGDKNQGMSLPAFTSVKEFNLEFGQSNIFPVSFEFGQAEEFLLQKDFDGIVINPHIDDFFVSRDIISDVLADRPSFTRYHKKRSTFSDDELIEIFHKENDHIDSYLMSDAFSAEELLMKLSGISLFTFITSPDDLDESIIRHDDITSMGILTVNEFGGEYNLIFNSYRHMLELKRYYDNDERRLYAFPTTLELMGRYVLELDLDGLILNYGFHSYRIPREVLLVYMADIAEVSKHKIKYDLGNYLFNLGND